MKILQGNFYEGETVTVYVNGKTVKRKVRYSPMAGDLYVLVDNRYYFLYEFWKAEEEANDNVIH